MSKFKKNKGSGDTPAISTASLPDIVFMLLFFFMVATVMREVDFKVKFKLPKASEARKVKHKNLVSYLYVGKPNAQYQSSFGTAPVVQLNDEIADIYDIPKFVKSERSSKSDKEAEQLTFAIKADEKVKMQMIYEINEQLKEAKAFKINYSADPGGE